MKDAVVILAPPEDVHAHTVEWEIRRMGGCPVVLDSAGFPTSWCIQMHASGDNARFVLVTRDGHEVEDDRIAGIWWRRTPDHEIPSQVRDPEHRRFCRSESRALFEGWAYSFGRRVINPLESELAARRKPYQLAVAARMGLTIPKTLCTNDPAAVEEMARDGGKYIYKILTNTPWQFTETRTLGEEEVKQLSSLRVAPVIFQEQIDGVADIRVTMVDDDIFPVELQAHHPEAWLDWRLDLSVEIRQHVLPQDVADKLRQYQAAMGLRYGAYDLRLTSSGEYVFFEVNPAGQYLFAEIHADVPISRSLAQALLSGAPEEKEAIPSRAAFG
jgi:hypothetical protein